MFTGSPRPAIAGGEEWRLAHQRALREAHGDDLDGNESAPYGLSVPANPRILQMRGRGKGTEGRGGRGQRGAGAENPGPGARCRGPWEGSGGPAGYLCPHRVSQAWYRLEEKTLSVGGPSLGSFCPSPLTSVSLSLFHVPFHLCSSDPPPPSLCSVPVSLLPHSPLLLPPLSAALPPSLEV